MDIRNSTARITQVALCVLIVAGTMTACTRHVSRSISAEGQAGELIFPPAGSAVLREGTFPNVDNLRQIGPGVTKDQLYDLIGRPHFREGFAAREWDYLFHFRQGDKIDTCQYKVIFDANYRGQDFHWLPTGCADQLKKQDAAVAGEPRRFELSADTLFAFARYDPDGIQPQGRRELDSIAEQLRGRDVALIQVVGHTDRIGSETDNRLLSQQRAQTVRELLVRSGVEGDRISAFGLGESQPLKQCPDSLPRDELVACLQPNRRVDVLVTGY